VNRGSWNAAPSSDESSLPDPPLPDPPPESLSESLLRELSEPLEPSDP
jgi:hypothetical protein